MQIQGDGPLKLVLVNGNDQQQIRALARLQGDIDSNMSLHQMIGKGVLVITIAPKEGERYQGIVPLDKPTISECLEDYFVRSEQLQTQLIIRSGEYDGKPVTAGVLLQIVPDGSGSPGDFEHLATLTATIKDEEIFGLSAEELLYRLYHEETVELFAPQLVTFHCGCSQERSGAALLLISEEEIDHILAEHQGTIDMQCECCGTHYFFNKDTICRAACREAPAGPNIWIIRSYSTIICSLYTLLYKTDSSSERIFATVIVSATNSRTTSLLAIRLTNEIYFTFRICRRKNAINFPRGVW